MAKIDDFRTKKDGIYEDMSSLSHHEFMLRKAAMERTFQSSRLWMLLVATSIIGAIITTFAYYTETSQSRACDNFLQFQDRYVMFLSDVDTYVFLASNTLSKLDSEVKQFSSQSALAIELSDPFGVSFEAARLNDMLRAYSNNFKRWDEFELSSWRNSVTEARSEFVSKVQKTNPCN